MTLMMKRVFLNCLLAITALGLVPNYSIGQISTGGCENANTSGQTCAITTAVPFLMISPDARSGALADAGVAIATGANGLYWNTAALPFNSKKMGFALNYTPWLRALGIPDINHAYLPGYYNIGDKGGVVGAALTFFSLGDINLTNNVGDPIGIINPSELAFDVSYARKVTDNFSAGVSLRYIYSGITGSTSAGGISTKPGQSFAGDIDLFYTKDFKIKENDMNFSWGLTISNIGAKMNYSDQAQKDFIPTNLKLGYAISWNADEYNKFTFINEFNKLLVPSAGGAADIPVIQGMLESFGDANGGFSEELTEINWTLAAEYTYNDLLSARSGFFYEDPNKGARKFLTFGAGLKFKVFTLDISYLLSLSQNHPLQNTFRFSLSFDFGEKVESED